MALGRRSVTAWVAAWFALLAALGSVLLVIGCTTANPAMTFLFDGVTKPGDVYVAQPVVKKPRRLPYQKPAPKVKFVEVPDLPPPIDWKGRYEALPRNDAGDAVLWVKALDEKVITPRPGIADDAKDEEPQDIDVAYDIEGQPEMKVVFAHKPHTMWMGCTTCHTGIFEMEKGKAKMTMANLGEGAYCGACHGKVASPDLNGCPACHVAMGK